MGRILNYVDCFSFLSAQQAGKKQYMLMRDENIETIKQATEMSLLGIFPYQPSGREKFYTLLSLK
ncbi:MAG: hypothetical protein GQ582_06165 [Methyloprofundus sp.]|nr:hypothetical protein [Methyloprofundus sp.]